MVPGVAPPGGAPFFSGRGVRPRFPKCRACELTFASEKGGLWAKKFPNLGGLWAENFQIWGLVSWKFPNLGACELKFGWKSLLRLKFPNFKRGSCELTLLLEMGPLRAAGEAWKGGLQGRTSPYPLFRGLRYRGWPLEQPEIKKWGSKCRLWGSLPAQEFHKVQKKGVMNDPQKLPEIQNWGPNWGIIFAKCAPMTHSSSATPAWS